MTMGAAAILLLAGAAQFQDAPPATIVAGHVVDAASGRPIPGAVISSAGPAVAPEPGASGPVRVITNAGGAFVLRGVSRGSLVLTAVKAGYVNAQPGQRRPEGSAQPIHVHPPRRITDVEIRMWRYASIA